MSLTVMTVNLNPFQKKSYELKFSLQAGCRKIVRSDKPCRIEFHIETLQSSLIGLSAKHTHLYQDPSLRETGFRKWLKLFFVL